MRLPFTLDQFFDVFQQYNEAVWPAQILLTALALLCVALALRPKPWSGAFISAALGVLWAWLAVAYHLAFFTRINPLAYVLAAVSALGAVSLFWFGAVRRRLWFSPEGRGRKIAGLGLIVYALAIYPALSVLTGHGYPRMPTFGLPCPTTIFTIGMLSLAKPPVPRLVLAAPVLWCAVGVQAAFLLGVPQDLMLAAAGLIGLAAMRGRTRAAAR